MAKKHGIVSEFKEFITRGNVIDLAVGLIMGSAFTAIVNSLVNQIIMPFLSIIIGKVNFEDLKWVITEADESAGVAEVAVCYGAFIQAIINFLLIALVIFLMIKAINTVRRKFEHKKEEEEAKEEEPKGPTTEELLAEIRDLLKEKEETKIEEICEHEHCHCEKNIALSALKHTLNIFLFIFIITLVINGIIEIIGQENLANIVSKNVILGPIVAGIIGLIPNCASSVVLTELFVENVISMPILISGLCVNAGVGLLVLFKTNENKKENLKIIGLLYAIGVISGLILEIII